MSARDLPRSRAAHGGGAVGRALCARKQRLHRRLLAARSAVGARACCSLTAALRLLCPPRWRARAEDAPWWRRLFLSTAFEVALPAPRRAARIAS